MQTKLKLNSYALVPPGLFRYKDPITGHEMSRHVWQYLLDDVENHRKANNLPPVDSADIEEQMCQRMGESSKTVCSDSRQTVDGVSLGIGDIMRGTMVLASFKLAGSQLVSQEEATRRAAICATCLYNVDYRKPCGGVCQELVDLVGTIIGGAGTEFDDKLSACACCGCSIKAHVWLRPEELKNGVNAEILAKMPSETCWKRKQIEELA